MKFLILLTINLVLVFTFTQGQTHKLKTHQSRKVGFIKTVEDPLKVDSLIRTQIKDLKSNYFLFVFNTLYDEITLTPQILNDFNTARNYLDCDHDIVFLLYNKNIIQKSRYKDYLMKGMGLTEKEVNQIKIIENDSLYLKILEPMRLQRTYYFFNHELVYKEFGKSTSREYKNVLNYQKFKLEKNNSTELEDPKDFYFKTQNNFIVHQDKIYFISNFFGKLVSYDKNAGKILQIFDLNRLDPFYLYSLIQKDTFLVNYARAHRYYQTNVMRPILVLNDLFITNNENFLASVTMELPVPSSYDFKMLLDNGKSKEIKKGQTTFESFSFLLEMDSLFNVLQIYPFTEINKNNFIKTSIFDGSDTGYLLDNTLLYCTVIISNKFAQRFGTGRYGIGIYEFQNNQWDLKQIKTIYSRKVTQRDEFNYRNNFFVFQNDTFLTSIGTGGIYNITKNKLYLFNPIIKYPLKKEKYQLVSDNPNEDLTKQQFINFIPIASTPIFNQQYLASIYVFQEKKLLLEIRDSCMNVVGLIDLTHYQDFSNLTSQFLSNITAVQMKDDKIYLLHLVEDKFYISEYKISFCK